MIDFQKKYYEDDAFWNDTLLDPLNQQRIIETSLVIPDDVRTLLDVGCGNGIFLNYLLTEKPSLKVLGIDRSEAALKYLKTEKKTGSIDSIDLADRSFDCVTCLEVIEHLPADIYAKGLDELARVADRYLIVSVPFEENLEESLNQCPECKTIFNINLHFRSFTKEKLNSEFIKRGFTPIQTKTMGYQEYLAGHRIYSGLFYPNRHKVFAVNICPVCGFSKTPNDGQSSDVLRVVDKGISIKKRVLSKLTYLPRLFWPKVTKPYWVMSLFRRN